MEYFSSSKEFSLKSNLSLTPKDGFVAYRIFDPIVGNVSTSQIEIRDKNQITLFVKANKAEQFSELLKKLESDADERQILLRREELIIIINFLLSLEHFNPTLPAFIEILNKSVKNVVASCFLVINSKYLFQADDFQLEDFKVGPFSIERFSLQRFHNYFNKTQCDFKGHLEHEGSLSFYRTYRSTAIVSPLQLILNSQKFLTQEKMNVFFDSYFESLSLFIKNRFTWDLSESFSLAAALGAPSSNMYQQLFQILGPAAEFYTVWTKVDKEDGGWVIPLRGGASVFDFSNADRAVPAALERLTPLEKNLSHDQYTQVCDLLSTSGRWLGRAESLTNELDAVVMCFTALEVLCKGRKDSDQHADTDQFINRVATLYVKQATGANKGAVCTFLNEMYELRSKVVHTGYHCFISKRDIEKLVQIVRVVQQKFYHFCLRQVDEGIHPEWDLHEGFLKEI